MLANQAPRKSAGRIRYDARRFRDAALCGIAEIADRRKAFTASDDRNTVATSGSRTIATASPPANFEANRFGRDLE
jgi:hypothetical protein